MHGPNSIVPTSAPDRALELSSVPTAGFMTAIDYRPGSKSLALLCATAGMMFYFLVAGHPIWGTNDDPSMAMRAAGVAFSPDPTADLLFIHVLLGSILRQLYLLAPEVPWYAIVFLTVIFSSLTVLSHSVFRLRRDLPVIVVVAVACIATTLPALWHLQFTVVGGLAALSGMSALLSQASRKSAPRAFGMACLLALTLLFLGAMIRFQSCAMVLALILPALGMLILSQLDTLPSAGQKWKHLGTFAMIVACAGGGAIALEKSNQGHYAKDPEWSRWFQLNQAKASFIDYKRIPLNEETEPVLATADWTGNDHSMIMTWQYLDPVYFSLEKFETVLRALQDAPSSTATAAPAVDHVLRIRYDLRAMANTLNLFPILLIAGLLLMDWRPRAVASLLLLLAAATAVTLFLYVELNRAPLRVQILLWFALLWPLLILMGGSRENKSSPNRLKRLFKTTLFIFMGALLVAGVATAANDARERVQARVQDHQDLHTMLDAWAAHLPEGAILYCMGTSLPFEALLPLSSFDIFRPLQGLVCTGVGNQSPTQRSLLAKLGLEENIYSSLAEEPFVYVVQRENKARSQKEFAILQTFYREKFHQDLRTSEDPNLPNLLRLEFSPHPKPVSGP